MMMIIAPRSGGDDSQRVIDGVGNSGGLKKRLELGSNSSPINFLDASLSLCAVVRDACGAVKLAVACMETRVAVDFSIRIGYAIGENVATNRNDEGSHHHHEHQGHSTTPHMDHSVQVFFTPKDLKLGNVIPTIFKGRNPSSRSPHFLPREESELIPFSPSKLPYLLKLFGFSQTSPQAKAMDKFCPTSLESMLDFVHKIFGLNTKFKALSTKKSEKFGSNNLQNYTIVDAPKEILAPKMVACHTMPYPYVVYYCHFQESESKVFHVSLRGEDNNIVQAVAVCHMDTSQWSPDHASFRVLGINLFIFCTLSTSPYAFILFIVLVAGVVVVVSGVVNVADVVAVIVVVPVVKVVVVVVIVVDALVGVVAVALVGVVAVAVVVVVVVVAAVVVAAPVVVAAVAV
uniref:BURP domain-containing protein n=1 Tax=Chenopodium quinoa TaxID=63459 RepID=A0A803LDT6_CHEQI